MLDQVFEYEMINAFGLPSFQIPIRQLGVTFGCNIDLLVVGLSYLVSTSVLMSVWLFHILITLEDGILGYLGITASLPAQPHAPANVLLAHQQIGSLVCILLLSLWMARGSPRPVAGHRLGPRRHGNEPHRPPLGGMVYMAGFLHATGLALAPSRHLLLSDL